MNIVIGSWNEKCFSSTRENKESMYRVSYGLLDKEETNGGNN